MPVCVCVLSLVMSDSLRGYGLWSSAKLGLTLYFPVFISHVSLSVSGNSIEMG